VADGSLQVKGATPGQAAAMDYGRRPTLVGALSIIVGLLLWELAATQFSHFILPPPLNVFERFIDPAFGPRLLDALRLSFIQLGAGFGLALAIALPLGILIGRSHTAYHMFNPLINALYAIPPVALIPFLIIWFGLFLEARIALVFLMCFFDILVIIIAGARDVRSSLVDVGRSFGASRALCLRLVVLPALTPFLFAALRVGSARAINGMITAELFFAAANLGAILKRSAQAFDSASALAVVVTICLVGLAAQALIQALERRVLHWHLRA